jgi:hypothetical protein
VTIGVALHKSEPCMSINSSIMYARAFVTLSFLLLDTFDLPRQSSASIVDSRGQTLLVKQLHLPLQDTPGQFEKSGHLDGR